MIRLATIVLKIVSVGSNSTEQSVLMILAFMPPSKAKLKLRSQITPPDTLGTPVPSARVRLDPPTGCKNIQYQMHGNRGNNPRNKTGGVKKVEKGGAREERAVNLGRRQVQHLLLHPPAETGLGSSAM